MNINWNDVATIAGTMAILGGIMIGLLKGFFVTTKACLSSQKECQSNVCKKIDDLQEEIKEDRKIANQHYTEIKEALAEIRGKLNA